VRGSESGIAPVIDFSLKHNLPTSFFITGRFAEDYPKETKLIHDADFDIGLHGWDHGIDFSGENFRTDSYEEQKSRIQRTIAALVAVTGERPRMNRNPNLWVSEDTLRVLEEEGIAMDSSVPAMRAAGRIRSLRYLMAPTTPYYPSFKNLARRGDSKVLEVAPSAFFVPINLSALRFIGLRKMKMVVRMYSMISRYLLFYGHPAEYMDPSKLDFGRKPVKRHIEGVGPQVFDLTKKFVDFVVGLGYEPSRLGNLIYEDRSIDDQR
jgi:hypothetical protein